MILAGKLVAELMRGQHCTLQKNEMRSQVRITRMCSRIADRLVSTSDSVKGFSTFKDANNLSLIDKETSIKVSQGNNILGISLRVIM